MPAPLEKHSVMDSLEGVMLTPPDRGQILGRAVWKARYLVVSRRSPLKEQSPFPQFTNSCRTSHSIPTAPLDEYYLSLFKSKPAAEQEWEPTHSWPLSSVSDCQVQTVAHRKQGPVLPTLIVTVIDQQRKRRSSRAAGLISSSSKEPAATVLWFRSPNDEPHVSLHDWARFILSRKGAPLSPDSPITPALSNPFSPKPRDASDYYPRPTSGSLSGARNLQHKNSTASQSTVQRERPLTFSSVSPSLRSKRSDVSSPSNYSFPTHQIPFDIPGQQYTTVLPTDLPSPTTSTATEYHGGLIEGWTSAQGRSSTVSSPYRGRDSISSHAHQASITESSSPPAPRETILDRAFQMKCIPGSEEDVPGEEKLSSLARFEALMREADDKRKQREDVQRAEHEAIRSTFDADDSTDDEDIVPESDTDTDSGDEYSHEQDIRGHQSLIPSSARQALQFLADRHDTSDQPTSPIHQRRPMSRNPVSFHGGSMTSLSQAPPLRPHTSHAKSRPNNLSTASGSAYPPSPTIPMDGFWQNEEAIGRPGMEKRQSNSSAKRLSFTEFTKRLSSTSSLLLVQTNASSGSSREGGDFQMQTGNNATPRGSVTYRNTSGLDRDEEKRCGWRGSVLGAEGGFL